MHCILKYDLDTSRSHSIANIGGAVARVGIKTL
jgi:hypothetical protein